jgi:2-polyprenyl-3-methyl-5-hydroxy-6-metoxy-1,4-benzoquinol methylase
MSQAILQSEGKSSEIIHERAIQLLQPQLREESELLDLGCGAGAFSRRVRALGVKAIHCCDGGVFGDVASQFLFRQLNLNQPLSFATGSFDLVVSLEVVEHIENPRAFVREIHRVLKPGAAVLLSTPNNESFTSLLSLALRGYFSAFSSQNYPAHITPLLEIDAVRIFRETGFREIETHFTDSGRMPGVSIHWQRIFGRCARGKRFSDNFFVKAVK